jgi:hypothetical protein
MVQLVYPADLAVAVAVVMVLVMLLADLAQ